MRALPAPRGHRSGIDVRSWHFGDTVQYPILIALRTSAHGPLMSENAPHRKSEPIVCFVIGRPAFLALARDFCLSRSERSVTPERIGLYPGAQRAVNGQPPLRVSWNESIAATLLVTEGAADLLGSA